MRYENENKKYLKPLLIISTLFLFLFMFSIPVSTAAINDSTLYYGFGDTFPVDLFAIDLTENNQTMFFTDSINMHITDSKLGDYAIRTDHDDPRRGTANLTATPSLPVALSMWYKPQDLFNETGNASDNPIQMITSYAHGNTFGQHGIHLYSNGSFVNASTGFIYQDLNVILGFSTTCTTASHYRIYRTDSPTMRVSVTDSGWNHIVVNIGAFNDVDIWINGENVTESSVEGTATGITLGDKVKIGNVTSTCATGDIINHDNFADVDEYAAYDHKLTVTDIASLYNEGFGDNPFIATTPVQTDPLVPLSMNINSVESYDYNQFFRSDINASLSFVYNDTVQTVYDGQPFSSSDFDIVFFDALEAVYFSKGNDFGPIIINVTVCNDNCIEGQHSFSIAGSSTPIFENTVNDSSVAGATTIRYTFSDHFDGYTRRWYQFTDPDDNLTVNVSSTNSASNTCFDASIAGDILTIETNNVNCDVDGTLIVDNTLISAQSNVFTISVSKVSDALNFFQGALTIFPDSEDVNTTTALLIVGIFMAVTIVAIMFTNNGVVDKMRGGILSMLIILEIIFFTLIGYIPVWITILIILIAVIVGTGLGRKLISGGGIDGNV